MSSWKQDMMDRLRLMSALQAAREGLPLQLKELEKQLETAPDGQKKAILERCCQLRRTLEEVQLHLEQTQRALSALNPEERLVLHRYYVCRSKDWLESLCVDLGVERSSVYRRKDRALAKFAMAMYGLQVQ